MSKPVKELDWFLAVSFEAAEPYWGERKLLKLKPPDAPPGVVVLALPAEAR